MPTTAGPAVRAANLGVIELSIVLERVGSWIRLATPEHRMGGPAATVLNAVVTAGPQRISDLVIRERISQPGMTALVSRLVAAGLVERREHPTDGRATLVAATGAGHAYVRDLHRARAAALVPAIQQLSRADQRALSAARDALTRLSAVAVERTVADPP